MSKWSREILTPLGARIRLVGGYEHLGSGVMLILNMQDSSDPRWAEVFLSVENMKLLAQDLDVLAGRIEDGQ